MSGQLLFDALLYHTLKLVCFISTKYLRLLYSGAERIVFDPVQIKI